MSRATAIANVRIFDGERAISDTTVLIGGARIEAVGPSVPRDAVVVDGRGATLMPGLIDSHVHTDMAGLRDALKFGVTTELEMMGRWSARRRREIAERNDVADLRSAEMGVTPKGGHPTEYMNSSSNLFIRFFYRFPSVSTPGEAARFVSRQVSRGADYIKVFIEDGSCIGFPGLPVLDDATLAAAVKEAHRHDKLAIAHITTAEGAQRAVDAGVDGLGHLFLDSPTRELIDNIATAGVFVVPTLVTLSTAFGNNAATLAADERVRSRLDKRWLDSLSRSMNVYPPVSGPCATRAWTYWRALTCRNPSPSSGDSRTAPVCIKNCNCWPRQDCGPKTPCARPPPLPRAGSGSRTAAASSRARSPTCCSSTAIH